VKKIADEHGTRVDIANRMVDGNIMGAQVSLSFATENVALAEPGNKGNSKERA